MVTCMNVSNDEGKANAVIYELSLTGDDLKSGMAPHWGDASDIVCLKFINWFLRNNALSYSSCLVNVIEITNFNLIEIASYLC